MKCSQTIKTAEQLPRIQEELENRKAALNAVSIADRQSKESLVPPGKVCFRNRLNTLLLILSEFH